MMSTTARWLEEQRRDAGEARPTFEAVLLGQSPWPYARRRLGLYVGLQSYAAALQIIEYLFFFSIFAPRFSGLALAAVNLGVVTQGAIAGSLEIMRQRLRSTKGQRRRHAIASVWLSTYAALGALAIAAAILFLVRAALGANLSPDDGIVAAVFLRAGLDLFSRAYHAGIFAFFRVYRPTIAALLVESTAFAATLVLSPLLGPWAFPVALVIAATSQPRGASSDGSDACECFHVATHIASERVARPFT